MIFSDAALERYGAFDGLLYSPREGDDWCDNNFPASKNADLNAKCKNHPGCLFGQCAGVTAPWTAAGRTVRGLPVDVEAWKRAATEGIQRAQDAAKFAQPAAQPSSGGSASPSGSGGAASPWPPPGSTAAKIAEHGALLKVGGLVAVGLIAFTVFKKRKG